MFFSLFRGNAPKFANSAPNESRHSFRRFGIFPFESFSARPKSLNCCRGSRSTLDITIRGPSITAIRSREKFRFCSLQETINQQDWDNKLPFFLHAHRSTVHETIGYSPSQMLFRRDLRLPTDLLFSHPPDTPLAPEKYIEKLQARMDEMHHLARERIGMASEKMKTQYDARVTGHDFHEGDKVWLWNPKRRKGLSSKLQTNWEDPYTVLKRLNDVVVRIQKSPYSKPKVIHYSRLAPYLGQDE
ncbi:retrovirus-related Pol polyprotein from transposon 412 [Trichonephila clavipes]|nr:retrovirus-related Pol polyprotein from transposon 412 [Trichonephila clavipes]